MIKILKDLLFPSSELRQSLAWMRRVAEEIGADPKVFGTALTEAGVNYATWMKSFESQSDNISDEQERLVQSAVALIPFAYQGVAQLTSRYGDQPQLDDLHKKMAKYMEAQSYK